MRLYDISVPLQSGGVVYPGNPEIRIDLTSDMSKGASSNVSTLSFGSHSGTHVDAPLHMVHGGAPVDTLPLEVLVGPAFLVAVPDDVMVVDAEMLRRAGIEGHERVLVRTRNSRFVTQPGFVRDYTYIAPDAAEYLVECGVRLIGVDYYSIEQYHSGHHRTHLTLLGKGVVIVEGLDLSAPPPGEYDLCCLPLRLAGVDGAPARAILRAG